MTTLDQFERRAEDEQPGLPLKSQQDIWDAEEQALDTKDAEEEAKVRQIAAGIRDYWVTLSVRLRLPQGFDAEALALVQNLIDVALQSSSYSQGAASMVFFAALRQASPDDQAKQAIIDLLEDSRTLRGKVFYDIRPARLEEP